MKKGAITRFCLSRCDEIRLRSQGFYGSRWEPEPVITETSAQPTPNSRHNHPAVAKPRSSVSSGSTNGRMKSQVERRSTDCRPEKGFGGMRYGLSSAAEKGITVTSASSKY